MPAGIIDQAHSLEQLSPRESRQRHPPQKMDSPRYQIIRKPPNNGPAEPAAPPERAEILAASNFHGRGL